MFDPGGITSAQKSSQGRFDINASAVKVKTHACSSKLSPEGVKLCSDKIRDCSSKLSPEGVKLCSDKLHNCSSKLSPEGVKLCRQKLQACSSKLSPEGVKLCKEPVVRHGMAKRMLTQEEANEAAAKSFSEKLFQNKEKVSHEPDNFEHDANAKLSGKAEVPATKRQRYDANESKALPTTIARHDLKNAKHSHLAIPSGDNARRNKDLLREGKRGRTNKEAMRESREQHSMEELMRTLRRAGPAFSANICNTGGLGCSRAAVAAGFKLNVGTEINKDMKRMWFKFSGRHSKGDTFSVNFEEEPSILVMTSSHCGDFAMSTVNPKGVHGQRGAQMVAQATRVVKTGALVICHENVFNMLNVSPEAVAALRSFYETAGYVVHEAVVATWHFGDVGNKRHMIFTAISKKLGPWALNYRTPRGRFSDHVCFVGRDVIDEVVDSKNMRYGSNDTPMRIRNNAPGAIGKVGQRAPGHGPAYFTHAAYRLDSQLPCITTQGGGRRVEAEWQEGDPITNTVMVSISEASKQRGFPDDYVPFLREHGADTDAFVWNCLGNAISQGFIMEYMQSIQSLLQVAGVTHDVASSICDWKTGRVMHNRVEPQLPDYDLLEKEVATLFTSIVDLCPDQMTGEATTETLTLDTGAQAFVVSDKWNQYFKDGGMESNVTIVPAAKDAQMPADRMGEVAWATETHLPDGSTCEPSLVVMPKGSVHTVSKEALSEDLAGYEPLYQQKWNLDLRTDEESGTSRLWKRIRDAKGNVTEKQQVIPVIRDHERHKFLITVTPIRWGKAVRAEVAKCDRQELTHCLSAETVKLAHQHLLSDAEVERVLTDLKGKAIAEVCQRKAFGCDIEEMVRSAMKSTEKAKEVKEHAEEAIAEHITARALSDKNIRGAKAVLPKSKVRNLTEKEYVNRLCHLGCTDSRCKVCLEVDGPPRRFITKVDPYKETRPGYIFSLDMVEFDWRAYDGSKYVPQLRCMACHMMFEMTLVFKDDFYEKFDRLMATLRNCKLFKHVAWNVVSMLKLDNDSVWSATNEEFRKLREKYDIDCKWPSKEDDRDCAEAEETCKIVERGVKKAMLQQNEHPVMWVVFYRYFIWVSIRLATVSNSAIRSPDGDQSRPLEDFTMGFYSRQRISHELCSAVLPGSVILAKVKGVLGSTIAERSEYLVAIGMHGDQVVAMNPWMRRKRKLKQFVALTLSQGMTWRHFFKIDSPGFFRSKMTIQPETLESTKAAVVLPRPKTMSMPKMSIHSDEMVKALRHVNFVPMDEDAASEECEHDKKAKEMLGITDRDTVSFPSDCV